MASIYTNEIAPWPPTRGADYNSRDLPYLIAYPTTVRADLRTVAQNGGAWYEWKGARLNPLRTIGGQCCCKKRHTTLATELRATGTAGSARWRIRIGTFPS